MIGRFEKSFLLGLYLFLRQLQLSIDRSLNDDWAALVEYLSCKTSVLKVLDKLQSASTIDLEKSADDEVEKPRLSRGLSSVVGRKNCLSDKELIFIYAKLRTMATFLLKDKAPDREVLINLRMDLQHSEELVRSRISSKSLTDKEFVEHFNQNESLACKGVEELVGGSWL